MDGESTEQSLVEAAIAILRERLPDIWKIDLLDQPDFRLLLGNQFQGQHQLLVEVVQRFKPGDIDALNGRLGRRLRTLGGSNPILVVSDYLSPKSRGFLAEEQLNFIDLTGNVRIALDNQGIFIEMAGGKAPPGNTQTTTLRGATAGRLIRFLIDVEPPYRVLDIESATNINKGYISKLLEIMTDEMLIERVPRGPVTKVDWQSLLRRRSLDIDLLRINATFGFITRGGIGGFLEDLANSTLSEQSVITGSVAAERLAPVTSASTLMIYSKAQSEVVRTEFDLIPADKGGDLTLLRPSNDLPYELTDNVDRLRYAAPSQIAIDCLSGPGRMPAEGEAIIAWMASNESRWRCRGVSQYRERQASG